MEWNEIILLVVRILFNSQLFFLNFHQLFHNSHPWKFSHFFTLFYCFIDFYLLNTLKICSLFLLIFLLHLFISSTGGIRIMIFLKRPNFDKGSVICFLKNCCDSNLVVNAVVLRFINFHTFHWWNFFFCPSSETRPDIEW